MSSEQPLIKVCGVEKRFGHVHALRGVDLEIFAGEVVAVIGDNGAGKSTLATVIAGGHVPDAGWVEIAGQRIEKPTARLVHELGVETVYQSLALGPDLSIAENMFLGREIVGKGFVRRRLGVLDRREMAKQTEAALDRVGMTNYTTVNASARALSGGQRQAIAVARSVAWASRAILMDEPTAALAIRQTRNTNEVIRAAAAHGLGVMVITHDIPNMLTYADRIVVMRHGQVVAVCTPAATDLNKLVGLMVGEEQVAA